MYRIFSLLIALVVILTDQLTKAWIRANLAPGESLFQIGFFRIDHVRNTGAAFGLFPNHSGLLTGVSVVGSTAIFSLAIFAHRIPFLRQKLTATALGLVLAGTGGNLIDRMFIGYVTDFLDFTYWPAFNVADSAISVGVLLFAYALLFESRKQ